MFRPVGTVIDASPHRIIFPHSPFPIFTPNTYTSEPRLASVKHGSQGGLLSRSDGKIVDGLDLDPHLGVGAVVRGYS
jgi:hypothetical protein